MNAIYKREMLAYFTTPSGYVFSAIFFALSGILFSISTFGMQSASTRIYFITMLVSFCVLIPLLTMKLLSEERKSKTEQIILTSPVSLMGMISAKFFAAYTMFAGTLILSCALNITALYKLTQNQKDVIDKLSLPTVFGSIIGILLIGGAKNFRLKDFRLTRTSDAPALIAKNLVRISVTADGAVHALENKSDRLALADFTDLAVETTL